jgi:hypothetical protein
MDRAQPRLVGLGIPRRPRAAAIAVARVHADLLREVVPEEDSIILAKVLISKINIFGEKADGPIGGPSSALL